MIEVLVEGHNTTKHDGGVAILPISKPDSPVALASERISRKKHDGSSQIAYSHLKDRLSIKGFQFGGSADLFNPAFTEFQPLHHHLAHAAAAYYPSGFEEAAVLVIDGQGAYEFPKTCASSSIWKGKNQKISLLEANTEDDIATQSIGHLYGCISYYLGFGFLQEGKVMGLAAYGEPSDLLKVFQKYIIQKQDGQYYIHPKFVRALIYLTEGRTIFGLHSQPSELTREVMSDIVFSFGPQRQKGASISQRDKNLAWAVQHTAETLILGLTERTHALTGSDNLCYSGGVALNSVANGKIREVGTFKNIFIMPAAGDEGQALGRLLYRANNDFGIRKSYVMENAYLGPEYDKAEIVEAIKTMQELIVFTRMDEPDLLKTTAGELANGKIIGWWQGRSEIGPRALGNRSILADPRGKNTRDFINFTVKHREWFRPLAPSILLEFVPDYFERPLESPYMLDVASVKPEKRNVIPAVTHIDGTARLQTVTEKENGRYYRLIKEFGRVTGIPIVLNTSFNDAGEPIVETPLNAINSFLRMNLDSLVLEDFFIKKR